MNKRQSADLHNYNRWLWINANPPKKRVVNLAAVRQARQIMAVAVGLEAGNAFRIHRRSSVNKHY